MGATMIYSILLAPLSRASQVRSPWRHTGCGRTVMHGERRLDGAQAARRGDHRENGEATGGGVGASRAPPRLVSNATVWDTMPLLLIARSSRQGLPQAADWKEDMSRFRARSTAPVLGIDAEGLPDLDPSHLAVLD